MTVPGTAPQQRGIYGYIRHPNYLGVELEILSAPLVHSAYLTSAAFGLSNALLLRARIRREEQALEEEPGDRASFRDRPRFLPRWTRTAYKNLRVSHFSVFFPLETESQIFFLDLPKGK